MLTATITNLSTTVAIAPGGPGVARSLPGPFSWISIAAGGGETAAVVCRVQDITESAERLSGFSVADALQQMVQLGYISVAFANFADTAYLHDVDGAAIANET